MLQPRIEILPEKKLIGLRMNMSFSNNRTAELWRSFMPRRKEIKNTIGSDLYSVGIYAPSFFANFDPDTDFERWAAVEVTDFDALPIKMEPLKLPGGLYAVFIHKGPASEGPRTFQHIFGTWLPQSDFALDTRPHFEIMGAKYKHEDPNSEEEVWIPVKEGV